MTASFADLSIWLITAFVLTGIVVRPFGWPEAIWAAAGGLLLVVGGLIPASLAWHGVTEGFDVYLFLIGMMVLSEIARTAGVFDLLAAWAVRHARGSPLRLFVLLYLIATMVTALLSNDATAVVMPPAIYVATRAAGAPALPYLLICAFVANAASFILPISNPANLVVYGRDLPDLLNWLAIFGLPSLISVGMTFVLLWLSQRRTIGTAFVAPPPTAGAAQRPRELGAALLMLTISACIVVTASTLRVPLGWPTLLAGVLTACVVLIARRESPRALLRHVSWSVIPLVAGLFIIVEALGTTGVVSKLASAISQLEGAAPGLAAWWAGIVTAVASNITNNLPAGLLASQALQAADAQTLTRSAVMVAIDLGPNLSITGSLATILWLIALRREGLQVGFWQFLRLGLLLMPLPLLATLGALIWILG